jgi:hypothetical protein
MNDTTHKTNLQSTWDIYPDTSMPIRLGEVEAADEREAIEKAAQKFKQDPAMLIVIQRPR